jgi:hypothetical protein
MIKEKRRLVFEFKDTISDNETHQRGDERSERGTKSTIIVIMNGKFVPAIAAINPKRCQAQTIDSHNSIQYHFVSF